MIRRILDHPGDIDTIRQLFREYQDFLGISLCFQSFEEELDSLPGKYSPEQNGSLYLAEHDGKAAGCVAFYRVDHTTCELKRLFVRPRFQKLGLGKSLMDIAIRDATGAGYQTMILDSLSRLEDACRMYKRFGFEEIEPYNVNPHADVKYFSRSLVDALET